jgi:hypothetical protein
LSTHGAAQAYEGLAVTRVTPPMPYPGYLPMTDAAVATPLTRVTDPGRQMLPRISCKPAYCTHHYSGSVVGHQFSWTGKIPISRVRLNPPTQLDQTLAQE